MPVAGGRLYRPNLARHALFNMVSGHRGAASVVTAAKPQSGEMTSPMNSPGSASPAPVAALHPNRMPFERFLWALPLAYALHLPEAFFAGFPCWFCRTMHADLDKQG